MLTSVVVISDTHGDIDNVCKVQDLDKVDYMIHLGDNEEDVSEILKKYPNLKLIYIKGNHDEYTNNTETFFEICGVPIFSTHGHLYDIKYGYDALFEKAKKLGAKIILCGHTHIQKCINRDGIFLINPGSLSESREKNVLGSYTILQFEEDKVNIISRWFEKEDIIGVEINNVVLKDYNPEYKKLFEQEKSILMDILGEEVIDIQHVGSTSITSILSKPILDIVVAVKDIGKISEIEEKLVRNKYIYKGIIDGPMDKYQFLKGNSIKRFCHIYVTELNSESWYRFVLFRDYMNSHIEEAIEYERLKEKLARLYPEDRRNYTKHKSKYIDSVIEKARELYLGEK